MHPTNTPKDATNDAALEAELARLRREHDDLVQMRVRTERDVEHAKKQLEDLTKQAEEAFGTSDPEELAAELDRRRKDNAEKVAAYRAHVAEVRKALSDIESQ